MSRLVRRVPTKPTKKLIQAHFNAQMPLDRDAAAYQRKKPRAWKEDDIGDLGTLPNVPDDPVEDN